MHPHYRMLSTSFRALRRHKMRSALTCLGIVVGIGSVIAMVEIGRGSSKAVESTISAIGACVIQVDPAPAMRFGVSTGAGGRVSVTPDDGEAILRECPAVCMAAPSVDCHVQIVYGNRNWMPNNVRGVSPEYLRIRNWTDLTEGTAITDDDVRAAAAVCMVGATVVRELFKGVSPVGQEIRVKNVGMKVIGVLSPKGANMMGRDEDDIVICPWTTVKFRLQGSRDATAAASGGVSKAINSIGNLYPTGQCSPYPLQSAAQAANFPFIARFMDVDDIFVSANSPGEIPTAIKQIIAIMRERHHLTDDQPDDFRIRDLTEISKTLAATSALMGRLLLIVATISLVVGGVGIMNIMLASVTERTREIGLRMAVGAAAGDIQRQFLTESVMLCFLGGIAGVGVGRGASAIITSILKWPTLPSAAGIAAALAVAVSIGLIFGFYPAWKASKMDPIEALRHE